MRAPLTSVAVVAVLAASNTVLAQTTIGATGYASFGSVSFTASDTFEAVTGSARKTGFGVGGTLLRLWGSLFVDVSIWQFKMDGERVFIDGGTTYPLGIAAEITFRPVDVIAGWRVDGGTVEPYAGGGISFAAYKEESDFAAAADNVSETKAGPVVLAGLDIPLGRLFRVGGEFRYRSITGILGEGGASQAFGENQLGGMAFAVRASIGR